MSVVLTGQRWAGVATLAAWWSAWSRMGWAHLVAVLMASLLMTVVDASIWIDRVGQAGHRAGVGFQPRGLDAAV